MHDSNTRLGEMALRVLGGSAWFDRALREVREELEREIVQSGGGAARLEAVDTTLGAYRATVRDAYLSALTARVGVEWAEDVLSSLDSEPIQAYLCAIRSMEPELEWTLRCLRNRIRGAPL